MSDFGAVLEYALALEASMPEADATKFEAIRPGVMGLTKRQKAEAEKFAAMPPEERAKAEAEAAKKKEEARAKLEEDARGRQEQAAAQAQQQAAQAQQQTAQQARQAQPAPPADDKRK